MDTSVSTATWPSAEAGFESLSPTRRFARTDGRVAFCRLTQLGLLRLLTNVRVMGAQGKTIAEVWFLFEQVLLRRQVLFAPEPEGTETLLAEHCQLGGSPQKFWTDGYLAAFARAGQLGLVTFDRDFERYPNLDLTLLRP